MPRKKVINSSQNPYHISARSNNREWFGLKPDDSWKIFCSLIKCGVDVFEMKVHAFVLMSNHFHLLASFPKGNRANAVNFLMRELAVAINDARGTINHVFGGRNKSCLISNPSYYGHVYRYVFLNPVRAGMVSRAEDYKYSTLANILGNGLLHFPLAQDVGRLAKDIPSVDLTSEHLNWIHQSKNKEVDQLIHQGLKRTEFSIDEQRFKRLVKKVA